ncbi:MAG: biotin--[acetyl-CoA-carboxylase] ligase [Sulfurovum sp.]|nr:biotin--[acetyl-CoA-carboxylase] ligase [Sulfurovum sp.]
MEVYYFDTLASTQVYLIEALKNKHLSAPVAVLAGEQSAGIGSRNNTWLGTKGNFFASIAVEIDALPSDLPLASASIYFSMIMKQVLLGFDANIWLKWPNDFYIESDKVGGTITKKVGDTLVCGIGINLQKSPNTYRVLEENIAPKVLLEQYLIAVEKFPTWKHIFSEFEIEFNLSRKFSSHHKGDKVSLANAQLCKDGSLHIEGETVYSLR